MLTPICVCNVRIHQHHASDVLCVFILSLSLFVCTPLPCYCQCHCYFLVGRFTRTKFPSSQSPSEIENDGRHFASRCPIKSVKNICAYMNVNTRKKELSFNIFLTWTPTHSSINPFIHALTHPFNSASISQPIHPII
jgi:hypothetical protein